MLFNVSSTELRRRKALLIFPLLVLPFITLAFWALGGGGGNQSKVQEVEGLNMSLPQANNKTKEGWDKLRFYEAADSDSAQWHRQIEEDRNSTGSEDGIESELAFPKEAYGYNPALSGTSRSSLETEKQIYEKISEINRQVSQTPKDNPSQVNAMEPASEPSLPADPYSKIHPGGDERPAEDSELLQLNKMIDKILDIQHPQRVKERMLTTDAVAASSIALNVSSKVLSSISHFGIADSDAANEVRLYSVDLPSALSEPSGITAVVHENQQVTSGSVVHFRLLQDVFLSERKIPEGALVHGIAELRENRLDVNITTIALNSRIYPVALKVYDLDGIEGINMQASKGRAALGESATNSLQSWNLPIMEPSLKARAAGAGIEAAKALISRKARVVKVALRAGYRVILQNNE